MIETDRLRARFSEALSAMYQAEVPHYGTLLRLVDRINAEAIRNGEAPPGETQGEMRREARGDIGRLGRERHGAIRLGTAAEMRLIRRLFAVLGMQPVGYYDLAPSGVPVHSTAFRPTERDALQRSPFRVFASLLRLERIEDPALREAAHAILRRRRIASPRAVALIERFEAEGPLSGAEADAFIVEALDIFRWHGRATVDLDTYLSMRAAHPLLADIVCFPGPHLNHLTPRVLDIDAAQLAMRAAGLEAKSTIEGPPRRNAPILLRQTSFRALSETVRFGETASSHTARFGEIEQRGAALTPAGRALYDRLLAQGDGAAFADFPDDSATLRRERLAYYRYVPASDLPLMAQSLDEAVEAGSVEAVPIPYEDFLPVSAAGIFRSNLAAGGEAVREADPRQDVLEQALGCAVADPFALYAAESEASMREIVP